MSRTLILLLALGILTPALSGCMGLFGGTDEVIDEQQTDEEKLKELGDTGKKIEDHFSENPKVYLFPNQQALPARVEYLNGTVDPGVNGLYEDKNDRGGNDYMGLEKRFDISPFIPVGQPAEVRATLFYANSVGSAADLDLLVDVPGMKTTISRENTDEWNWKFTVKTLTVNTIGVSGAVHDLGVQVQNGRVIREPLAFSIKLTITYVQHALTPGHAWAFDVPAEASGIILESAKAGGPENVEAKFSIIGPDDQLVAYKEYNDLAIPSQSIFIPTKGPGQYVFYAYSMRGGFLALKSDAPLENRAVKTLTLTETVSSDATPTPGIGGRPPAVANTTAPPAAGGVDVTVNVPGFPLEFRVFMEAKGTPAVSVQAQVTATSSKGKVDELLRYGRYDDERGSLGVSHDAYNSEYHPENLAPGDYILHIVNDGNVAIGYRYVTYTR